MTAAVETMAYANEVPWHGLGNKVTDKMSPAQMLKAAELDWTVDKQDIFLKSGKKIPNQFALVRSTDKTVLSVVGSTYKPVQNEIALDFFKKFTDAGHMHMETAGSLWYGRYVWALARLGSDFKLAGGDEVRGYLLVSQPHVRGKAMVIQFTPIRVVCWNTLTYALGGSLNGKGGSSFRMPHSQEFNDDIRAAAEEALGLAGDQQKEFQEAATLLAKKKAKPEQVEEYFCEILKFDPKKADKTKKGELKVPRALPKFQAALTYAPGQQMPSATGTWWGAYNAVSYVVDHQMGKERDTALRNAWLGAAARTKRRAFNLALDKAS